MARSSLRIGRGPAAALIVGALFLAHAIRTSSNPPSNLAFAERNHSVNSDTLSLAGLQGQFLRIADRVSPSVVAISVATTTVDAAGASQSDAMTAQRLESLLNKTTRMVGTGFIIDPDGYILTNEHVIGAAERIWVTLDNRKIYPAIVIGSDPRADLAVLKIPAGGLPAVSFAADRASRGQWTIALGNPYGLAMEGEMCMSVGVVSATDRALPKLASRENRLYSNLIQTTAEINPGNSGGPLFDIEGRVIGINTAVILPQKSTNGIGFAMPVTPGLLDHVNRLKEGREIVYGYLGVMVSDPTARQRRAAGIADELGARIDLIEPGTPAAESRLRVNDLVVRVDDQPVRDGDEFVRLIGAAPIDRVTRLLVHRDGHRVSIDITPRKRRLPSVAVTRESQRLRWRGMLLGPVPPHWESTRSPGARGLMVLGISPDSPLVKFGVREGAIITSVAGRPVSSVVELQQVVNDTPAEQCALEIVNDDEAVVATIE